MWSTIRQSVRALVRRPLASGAIIATLALGIGVGTAVFTLVNGVLVRPFASPHSARLVRVYQTYESLKDSPNPRLQAIWNRIPISYLNTQDLRESSRTLDDVGLYADATAVYDGGHEPVRLRGARIDAELFDVLAVAPALGRTIGTDDVDQGARVVVVSYQLWRRLGGGSELVGATLRLDGDPYEIIGVMPRGFQIAGRSGDQIWLPLQLSARDRALRNTQSYDALGVLRAGADLETAQHEVAAIAAQLAETFPATNTGSGVRLVPLLDSVVGESRPLLYLASAAAGVVFLLVCVNVAQLFLVMFWGRRHELALRYALGASRRRLVFQVAAEGLAIALLGGLLGLVIAALGKGTLLDLLPTALPRREAIVVDVRVLAFTLLLSVAAAAVCAPIPLLLRLRAWGRGSLADALPKRGHGGAAGGFVVAQIALSLALAAIAALLVTSYLRLDAVAPGYDPSQVLVQQVELPAQRYGKSYERAAFVDRVLERIRVLPEVGSASVVSRLPLPGPSEVWGFVLPGDDAAESPDWTQGRSASMVFVGPKYFETLGIAVTEGTSFDREPVTGDSRLVMVSEYLAAQLWPRQNAVGRTVIMRTDHKEYTVVGVAADIKHEGLAAPPGPLFYQPWRQRPAASIWLVVRGKGSADDVVRSALREAIRGVDPQLALTGAQTMDALVAESLHAPRSRSILVGALALLAIVLSLLGTFSVTSFAVSQQRTEIGVRYAMGASPARIRRLVLRRVLVLTGLGVVLGMLVAVPASRLLGAELFGVAPGNPAVFGVAVLLVTLTTLGAGLLPAHRAARIEPAAVLREGSSGTG